MAAPNGGFFIGDKMKVPGPHHESFKALWEHEWKKCATLGIYPMMFATVKDFEPVVEELIRKDMKEPYDWDAYAETFFPQAEKLLTIAKSAEDQGQKEKASEYYLRASAVYRISRFPRPRSSKQREAWTLGKVACLKGLSLTDHPTEDVAIPHKHGNASEGSEICAYYNLPPGASAETPAPLILIINGLDGYRTEQAVWIEGWLQVGCACLSIEIPGTGDSPADPNDPTSPDRQWSSVFDWIAQQEEIDANKIVAWGHSTGGYYAIRIAHTHKDNLFGVVAQGGGAHYMFDPRWLNAVNHLQYPFDLANTLAYKFGYNNDVEKFKEEAMKFSLLNDGTLDKPCTKLLLINGTEDEIFPIDDMYLALQHGSPKEVRFVSNRKHMGEPEASLNILTWIYKLLDIKSDPLDQLRGIPFKAKY